MFIGYPVLIHFLAKSYSKSESNSLNKEQPKFPEITVILCIYNASNKLEARLGNIFSCDYPNEKINIIIVSDGSTDNPQSVIDKLNHTRIKLISYPKNKGKAHALNIAIKHAKTELLAFIDVRQTFNKDAIKSLCVNFKDNSVGAVSGNLIIKSKKNADPGLYWMYEKWIRRKESDVYSLLGVTGAIYMARKSLIDSLPENTILDDMYIPLKMIKAGYKVKFEETAIAYDQASTTINEEFWRKTRTLAGNFQLIGHLPWLMHPLKNPVFFQFISHKVLRLILPYCLIYIFFASYFLDDIFFKILWLCQIIFYCYTYLSYHLMKKEINLPFSSVLVSFCSLSLASLFSFWMFLFFPINKLWKKR